VLFFGLMAWLEPSTCPYMATRNSGASLSMKEGSDMVCYWWKATQGSLLLASVAA